jgi:hypothetical protein
MTRAITPLALILIVAATSAGADDPIPGRDGAYQFDTASVEGGIYEGELGMHGSFILRFEKHGVVRYTLIGSTMRDLSWRQEGGVLHMWANNKFSEFRLTVQGNRLVGDGHNQGGEVWKLDLKRTGTIHKWDEAIDRNDLKK